MRKAFVIISLLIGSWTFGQSRTFVGFKAGGGASTAYMQSSLVPVFFDVGWLPGANFGFQITHFPEKFKSRVNAGIQLSVNYSQKGWIQSFPDIVEPDHKTRINFIEIPFEAVGYFGNKTKYYVSAGIFVEYAINDDVDPIPESATVDDTYPALYRVGQSHFYRYQVGKDQRLNYGPRGGAGLFKETKSGVFRIEGFFTFSIRSTLDFEPIESGVPDLSLSYGAGVSVGYMFSFGKLSLTD